MNEGSWFIIRTIRMAHRPSFSDKPARIDFWLEGLGRLGCETYYPLLRELRRVPRRMLGRAKRLSDASIIRPSLAPFLPGYVFVRGEGATGLKRIPCVTDYVRTTARQPAQISNELVAKLRAREQDGAIPGQTPAACVFAPEGRIIVANGPFASFLGTVERPLKIALADLSMTARLRLTLNVLGRATPVDLSIDAARKFSTQVDVPEASGNG
jgi:transcription antitermination factor NusG